MHHLFMLQQKTQIWLLSAKDKFLREWLDMNILLRKKWMLTET